MYTRRGAFAIATAAVFILFGFTAAACGDREEIATVVASVTPTPTSVTETPTPPTSTTEPPTATPNPPTATAIPSSTPTPGPTSTPTPTPTPTVVQLAREVLATFSWYREDGRVEWHSRLTNTLLNIAVRYPDLFANLADRPWLNAADTEESLFPLFEAVDRLYAISDTLKDGQSAILLLDMPFLAEIDGDEAQQLDTLNRLAHIEAESFNVFVDYSAMQGGITGDNTPHDLYVAYLRANDAEGSARLFISGHPEYISETTLRRIIEFRVDHPDVYAAVSQYFIQEGKARAIREDAQNLAAIDEDLALRLARMEFNTFYAASAVNAWKLFKDAVIIDSVRATEILEMYENNGGINTSNAADFNVEIATIVLPEIGRTLQELDWVRDGIDPPERTVTNDSVMVASSREEMTLHYIFEQTRTGETDIVEMVLERGWVQDKLTDAEAFAGRYLIKNLDPEDAVELMGMQFLEDVVNEDVDALSSIRKYIDEVRDIPGFSLDNLLDHRRIDGEITPQNLRYLEIAIEDTLEDARDN